MRVPQPGPIQMTGMREGESKEGMMRKEGCRHVRDPP